MCCSCPQVVDGEVHRVPLEVVLMVAAGEAASVGERAAVSLLAWCLLGDEVLLIMERPESCMGLVEFLDTFQVPEALALVSTLPIRLLGLLRPSQFSDSRFFCRTSWSSWWRLQLRCRRPGSSSRTSELRTSWWRTARLRVPE